MSLGPDDWKELSKFLWAGMLLPIGYVWKRVNNSVDKEDFKDAIEDIKEVIEKHTSADEKANDRVRDNLSDIFKRLEAQGRGIERIETAITFIRKP